MAAFTNRPRRVISIFVLAMLNVSMMASLRNLPLVADYGLTSVVFFLIVAVFFLLPSALISAELATGWPKTGGVYIWIREALGDRWGFFSIWMQWVHNVFWYPAILSFVAATLAFVIDPALTNSKLYVLATILTCFWGITLLNYTGIRTSTLFSAIGVVIGTIIPGAIIITLGMTWFGLGNPSQLEFTAAALRPDFSITNLVFLAGLFLAFGGLEVGAVHAGDVKDPQKNYPRSIILAAIITFVLVMLGALAIGIVIPKENISLVAGLMDAFNIFFDAYNMGWILKPMALLLVIGAVAEVNSWIAGPIKGLYATSLHGNLPPFFQNLNSHGMPTHLLLVQAIIVTLSSLVFLSMPNISSAFWILTAISAQTYLLMYLLMFISAIRLRYTKPHVPRTYRIPYQHKGIWILGCMGILACAFGYTIPFVPPSHLDIGNLFFYEAFLISSNAIMIIIPLWVFIKRQPHWVRVPDHQSEG